MRSLIGTVASGGRPALIVSVLLAVVIIGCSPSAQVPTAAPTGALLSTAPATASPAPASATSASPSYPASSAASISPAASSGGSPLPQDSAVSGQLTVDDSSAVDPISRAIGTVFAVGQPGVTVTFNSSGSFDAFCSGQADIYGADHRILSKGEADECAKNKIDYVELPIALDSVALVTAASNQEITCLGYPDLYALIGPESTGFASWQDANTLAAQLGSGAEFADTPLIVAGPAPDSEPSAVLTATVIAPIAASRQQQATLRTDYQQVTDDTALLTTLAGTNPGNQTLGWLPYGLAAAAPDKVTVLRIDAGDGCVDPTVDRMLSNAYPLSRELFLYVNLARVDSNPAVAPFLDEYLGIDGLPAVLANLPYTPLPDDVLQETRFAWEGR